MYGAFLLALSLSKGFVVIVSMMVCPVLRKIIQDFNMGFWYIMISGTSFFLLGLALIFLTLKKKVKGRLKKFLILTGGSAVGFLVSIFLHNFFYAAAVLTSQIAVLRYLFEVLHTIFFFIAIPLCPLGFLVGAVGSAVLFVRKGK